MEKFRHLWIPKKTSRDYGTTIYKIIPNWTPVAARASQQHQEGDQNEQKDALTSSSNSSRNRAASSNGDNVGSSTGIRVKRLNSEGYDDGGRSLLHPPPPVNSDVASDDGGGGDDKGHGSMSDRSMSHSEDSERHGEPAASLVQTTNTGSSLFKRMEGLLSKLRGGNSGGGGGSSSGRGGGGGGGSNIGSSSGGGGGSNIASSEIKGMDSESEDACFNLPETDDFEQGIESSVNMISLGERSMEKESQQVNGVTKLLIPGRGVRDGDRTDLRRQRRMPRGQRQGVDGVGHVRVSSEETDEPFTEGKEHGPSSSLPKDLPRGKKRKAAPLKKHAKRKRNLSQNDGGSGATGEEYRESRPVSTEENSCSVKLWQTGLSKRTWKDLNELDVCLSIYGSAAREVIESTQDVVARKFLVDNWKKTKQNILSVIKEDQTILELRKRIKEEKTRSRNLNKSLISSLKSLQRSNRDCQITLSKVNQAEQVEKMNDLKNDILSHTHELRPLISRIFIK